MKKILMFIFCVLLLETVNSQNYIPIPMDSAIWSVNSAKYFVHGDTVINSKTYSKVYWQSDTIDFNFDMNKAIYYAAIRNDTANKKVYGVYHKADSVLGHVGFMWISETPLFINCDTCELLLYDFDFDNWSDTITVYAFPFYWSYSTYNNSMGVTYPRIPHILQLKTTSKLVSIENYYGVNRKISQIRYEHIGANHLWIEGIGRNEGPFHISWATLYQGVPELLCFEEKKTILYKLDSVCYRFVNKDIGGVLESDFNQKILLFPNPSIDFVNLINTENVSYLIISDMLGRQVQSLTYSSRNESITVDTSKLPKGLYFISLFNKDFSSKKVLKLIVE